jgi:hypothetical protein
VQRRQGERGNAMSTNPITAKDIVIYEFEVIRAYGMA